MSDIKNNPYGKYNGNELDYILEVLQYNWQKPSVQVSLAGITDAGGAVPEITGLTFS